jgi:KipI family sensor histidine kinase inhibitor
MFMQPFGNIKQLVPVGADAIMLYFSGSSLEQANAACQQWLRKLDNVANNTEKAWLVECVPSYDSLLIIFDVERVDSHFVYMRLRSWQKELNAISTSAGGDSAVTAGKCHTLPVWYGASDANDLHEISQKTSLSIEEVISLHTSVEYKVYAVGFAPGFGYMGDIPQQLQCPRLSTPRKKVPQGAVAIADRQTAVYPSESPGGWNLMGLCPQNMLGKNKQPLLSAGDTVKFVSITESEFNAYHEG